MRCRTNEASVSAAQLPGLSFYSCRVIDRRLSGRQMRQRSRRPLRRRNISSSEMAPAATFHSSLRNESLSHWPKKEDVVNGHRWRRWRKPSIPLIDLRPAFCLPLAFCAATRVDSIATRSLVIFWGRLVEWFVYAPIMAITSGDLRRDAPRKQLATCALANELNI